MMTDSEAPRAALCRRAMRGGVDLTISYSATCSQKGAAGRTMRVPCSTLQLKMATLSQPLVGDA